MSPAPLFPDTSLVVALTMETDAPHQKAVELQSLIKRSRGPIVTSRAVTIEVGNYLARGLAGRLQSGSSAHWRATRTTEVAPLTEDLSRRALRLCSARPDKSWGLTDRVSFEIMRERGITEALTTDEHFEQAAFRARLR